MSNDTTRTKRCARCDTHQELSAFPGDKARKDGLHPYCRVCVRSASRAYYQANKDKVTARTSAWHQENPEVGRESSRRWRLANIDMVRERKRQEWARNADQLSPALRDNAYRKKYGISLAERDALAAAQGHTCALCGAPESTNGKRLAVDHDHATGTIRGLLCSPCNTGLGHFRDRPELLQAALSYLARASQEGT